MSTIPSAPIHKIQSVMIRFRLPRVAVLLVRERGDEGWLVLVGSHGWLFGSYAEAIAEAKWLACNLALSVREEVS